LDRLLVVPLQHHHLWPIQVNTDNLDVYDAETDQRLLPSSFCRASLAGGLGIVPATTLAGAALTAADLFVNHRKPIMLV
jgi:hypothetical protein